MNYPNFLGVGVMKSATTWLSECLRDHPDIFMSDIKEVHYFSNNYGRGRDWYLSHFDKVSGQKAIGEFSVSYFDDVTCADRIYNDLGPIKILINLRHPIDRFVSHVKYIYRVHNITRGDRKLHLDQSDFLKITADHPTLLTKGLYSPGITYYQTKFGKDNVLVTFKDDIDYDPLSIVRLVYRFLNVDEDYIPGIAKKQVSPGNIPKLQSAEKIRVWLYQRAKGIWPKGITLIRKYRIAELYRKLNNSGNELVLEGEVVQLLRNYYNEDICALERNLNIDLNHWKEQS